MPASSLRKAAWASSLAQLTGAMDEARTIAFGDIVLDDVREGRFSYCDLID